MHKTKSKLPLLTIDIITLFPEMFVGPFSYSITARAEEQGIVDINIHNLRKLGADKDNRVDDRPYGGGPGMVIKAEPVYKALAEIGAISDNSRSRAGRRVVYMSPQGARFDQAIAQRLSKLKRLVLVCGHYEGIDERVMRYFDEEISLGDFVLSGGEIAAMTVVDSVVRLLPGVTGNPESVQFESFCQDKYRLEHPQYTRPHIWRGHSVPKVLMSGDHKAIAEWRENQALKVTARKRPDMSTQSS